MNRFERTVRRVITNSSLTDSQFQALIELCEKMETVPFIRSSIPKQINSGDISCIQVAAVESPAVEPAVVEPVASKSKPQAKRGKSTR